MKLSVVSIGTLFLGLSHVLTFSAGAAPHRVFDGLHEGHMRPPLWRSDRAAVAPNTTTSTGAPYTPAQVQSAYGFNQLTNNGAGQTIAVVDAYDDSAYIQSDLNTFCSEFGLPAATVNIIYANGSKPSANSGWQEEESLDVEWAHAIAPGAKILLVEAASDNTSDLLRAVQAAVNNGATVVSMSWGGPEFSSETSYDSYFTTAGVTYVASAGDSGAGVEWPAASPNVLAVGGTSLTLNSSGGWAGETAWADGGGGISVYEQPQPAWQKGWFESAWTPVNRGVPDVAYLADPNTGVYVVYGGTWYEFGGTSVGAPQWSALIALANQEKSATLSGANGNIYSLANGSSTTSGGGYSVNAAYFHDITSGNDGSAQNDYSAIGYDLVTGVGSPLANELVSALNGSATAPAPSFSVAVSPGTESVAVGGAASYTVTVAPSGGYNGTVNLAVTGLPSGATASFTPKSITQSGSATLNVATSSTTSSGTYGFTVSGTDSTTSQNHSAVGVLVLTNASVAAATVTVPSVSYTTSGPRNTYLNINVAVANNLNQAVANASVSITLYYNGSAYGSGTASTGSNGQVTFTLQGARPGNYSTVITGVKATGLTWNGKTPSNGVYDPY